MDLTGWIVMFVLMTFVSHVFTIRKDIPMIRYTMNVTAVAALILSVIQVLK